MAKKGGKKNQNKDGEEHQESKVEEVEVPKNEPVKTEVLVEKKAEVVESTPKTEEKTKGKGKKKSEVEPVAVVEEKKVEVVEEKKVEVVEEQKVEVVDEKKGEKKGKKKGSEKTEEKKVAEEPKKVAEEPKKVVEEPKKVVEEPKKVVEEPKKVVEEEKAKTKGKKKGESETVVVTETTKVEVTESVEPKTEEKGKAKGKKKSETESSPQVESTTKGKKEEKKEEKKVEKVEEKKVEKVEEKKEEKKVEKVEEKKSEEKKDKKNKKKSESEEKTQEPQKAEDGKKKKGGESKSNNAASEENKSSTKSVTPMAPITLTPEQFAELMKYDLTFVHSQYLDLHLALPIIEFAELHNIHPKEKLLKRKVELLSKTNMIVFWDEECKKLTGKGLPGLDKRKADLVALLDKFKSSTQQLVTAVQKLVEKGSEVSFEALRNTKITEAQVETLLEYAQLLFSVSKYESAAEYLLYYRQLTSNQEKKVGAIWGHFASCILTQVWDKAAEDLNLIKDLIDEKKLFTDPLVELQQRVWLMHWALFVFFNHPTGKVGIIELFMSERYLNAIQMVCPHLLRYLTIAVITSKPRKTVLKDLVKTIQQESYQYTDPFTQFVECLYVNFDFENVYLKLQECSAVLANDFFTIACQQEFVEGARLAIFETYCQIHSCVDLHMLADKLGLTFEEAERWIVDLIRNTKIDAKIDSQANHVIMMNKYPTVHGQVIEQTQNILYRTYFLASSLERLSAAQTSH